MSATVFDTQELDIIEAAFNSVGFKTTRHDDVGDIDVTFDTPPTRSECIYFDCVKWAIFEHLAARKLGQGVPIQWPARPTSVVQPVLPVQYVADTVTLTPDQLALRYPLRAVVWDEGGTFPAASIGGEP